MSLENNLNYYASELQYTDKVSSIKLLNKLITDTTWQAYDQVISNPGVYEEVILTEDTVSDEKSFQLVKKQAKKKSS